MGLYLGGLLMTIIFFFIIAGMWSTGILAERNPDAVNALNCIPNEGGINQYAPGLPTDTIGNDCFNDINSSQVNIQSKDDSDVFQSVINGVFSSIPGANVIFQIAGFVGLILKGWILILEILLAGGPLSIFIFLFGIPLQLLQLYFIAQIASQVIAVFTGSPQIQ